MRMTTADDAVTAARAYIGTRWRDKGRSRRGLDCVGLLIVVGWETGLLSREYDVRDYPRRPVDSRLIRTLARWARRRPQDAAPMTGDLVAFVGSEGLGCHVGIVSRGASAAAVPGLVHASEELGRVAEHDLPRGRVLGLYRPGYEEG